MKQNRLHKSDASIVLEVLLAVLEIDLLFLSQTGTLGIDFGSLTLRFVIWEPEQAPDLHIDRQRFLFKIKQ